MLVSSLHEAVLENTSNCPVIFYLVHTTIPNYNWVTRILAALALSENIFKNLIKIISMKWINSF